MVRAKVVRVKLIVFFSIIRATKAHFYQLLERADEIQGVRIPLKFSHMGWQAAVSIEYRWMPYRSNVGAAQLLHPTESWPKVWMARSRPTLASTGLSPAWGARNHSWRLPTRTQSAWANSGP